MHKTTAGEKRLFRVPLAKLSRDARALLKAAKHLPAARQEAQRLEAEADAVLAEAEALKLQARLEDLTVWMMEKVKRTRKGSKTYTYWMACWREGDRTRNVHLESVGKIGCRGGQAEGSGDESGGTGDAGVTGEFGQCAISSKTAKLFVRYTKCLNKEG